MAKPKTPDSELPLATHIPADKRDFWAESDPERQDIWDRTHMCESVAMYVGSGGGRKRVRCSKAPDHVGPHVHYRARDFSPSVWRSDIRRFPFARWARDL